MSGLYLPDCIDPYHEVVGTNFDTFTTKKDVSPLPLPVINADVLRKGSKILAKAYGEYSSLTGAALTMGFWFGTRASAITGDVALSSVITTGTTPAQWPWEMEWEGFCSLNGVAGTLNGHGTLRLGASLTTYNADVPIPITVALRDVASFDTTIDRAIGVSATWGASSASNRIKVNGLRVMVWN